MIEKYKNLNPRDKNILETILIIIISIVLAASVLISDAIKAQKVKLESMKTILVKDNSRYFTVIGCAEKFIENVSNKKTENILLLIDPNYKERNRIESSNLYSYVPSLDSSSSYNYIGREMYEHKISKNVTEYFVRGFIKTNKMDELPIYMPYDMTVTLQESEFTFTVKPGIGGLDYEEQK